MPKRFVAKAMANIRDVARKAGVSIATVSATLNDRGPVSEETRRRVWDAVKAVGYSPNAVARSLRLGKSRLIGVVLGDITNPFCTTLVRVAEEAALTADYSIIVCNSDDDPERELRLIDQLRAQHVAGILLTASGRGPDYTRRLERRDLPPLVTIDQRVEGLDRDFVGVDNRAAARMLTEYLIRLGHRRIAMISGRKGLWTADERIAGFRETMQASGIAVESALCIQAAYRSDMAEKAAVEILTGTAPPTAIIGGNNVIALGALQAILALGFRCPDDISVAGIDDVPWSGLVRPRVTTAAQPIADITALAMEWLLARIADPRKESPPARSRVFQPYLIAGDSCRAVIAHSPPAPAVA
ncbi:MAG TPA: LacI family DNA-binding transcriptional regulator [Bauldia sp.]|nr:LacI family DNA-binding transcriptional regulator [Bauldia sp.]